MYKMCYYKNVTCKLFKYANWQEKKMEELKIISATKMIKDSLENQIKVVNKIIGDAVDGVTQYAQPAILLKSMVIFPEIREELIKNGYDVKVCEGKNTDDSWSEISWMNARKGELTEIKGEC